MADMARGFKVLEICRDDVAMALYADAFPGAWSIGGPGEYIPPKFVRQAESLTDDEMDRIATKVGDSLLEGGDYWEAAAIWAQDILGQPR